jgi:hypothetical protein
LEYVSVFSAHELSATPRRSTPVPNALDTDFARSVALVTTLPAGSFTSNRR